MSAATWTRKERFDEWTRLLDLPMDYDRPLTPDEDAQRLELEGLLFTKTEATSLPVEIMQAQLSALEAALDEPMSQDRADQVYLQMVDLQHEIEKQNGAMDDRYDAIICAKHGAAL